MTKITLQDIFNAAWQAFIVEDKQPSYIFSDDVYTGCAYDDGNGNCCAVGLVLPPDHPSRQFFGNFTALVKEYPELFDNSILEMQSSTEKSFFGSLDEFQIDLHDNLVQKNHRTKTVTWGFTKEEREKRYRNVALRFNLTIPGEPK